MYLILTLEPRIQLIQLPFTLLSLQYVLQGEVCTAVTVSQETSLPRHQTEAMKPVCINDASDFNHIASSIQLMDHNSCDCFRYAGHCAWSNREKEANFSEQNIGSGFLIYPWQLGVKEDPETARTWDYLPSLFLEREVVTTH